MQGSQSILALFQLNHWPVQIIRQRVMSHPTQRTPSEALLTRHKPVSVFAQTVVRSISKKRKLFQQEMVDLTEGSHVAPAFGNPSKRLKFNDTVEVCLFDPPSGDTPVWVAESKARQREILMQQVAFRRGAVLNSSLAARRSFVPPGILDDHSPLPQEQSSLTFEEMIEELRQRFSVARLHSDDAD